MRDSGNVAGMAVDLMAADSISSDSISADSAALDSSMAGSERMGIMLIDPAVAPEGWSPAGGGIGNSWVYLILAVLFCAVGLRFHNSPRYLKAILADLTETRVRQNVFDDTVRETSFLVLLNVLWCACAGVLLWESFASFPSELAPAFPISPRPVEGMLLCMGMCGLYMAGMLLAYWVTGNVFSNSGNTQSWLKGASASMAVETVVLLPTALLALSRPEWNAVVLPIAAGAFVLGKIVFILKGFRIFFSRFSSGLLFLYYLCGLEIVPLILTYVSTLQICSVML